MRLVFLIGTRPEVVKLVPVILAARERGHVTRVIFTGQHQHLALPLLEVFGIRPDLQLPTIKNPGRTTPGFTQSLLQALEAHRSQLNGDYLLVQGDTTTAFTASYWGFCHHFPIAHVEAGLRTHNLEAPFPEEADRQMIARLASIHFAPSPLAGRNLLRENVSSKDIIVIGNTAIDTLRRVREELRQDHPDAMRNYWIQPEIMEFIADHPMLLVTTHRRENFKDGIGSICNALHAISEYRQDLRILFPVHPNPNILRPVRALLGRHPRIKLVPPQNYVAFLGLMERAEVILTDSGGIQEEAPSLKKPVLILRWETERPEVVRQGSAKLVGNSTSTIIRETMKTLVDGCRGQGRNPYGDGHSAEKMIRVLEKKAA